MAKEPKEETPAKGGCLRKLFGLLVFLVIIGLGASVYFMSLPQDLSDISGTSTASTTPASPPRDMETVLGKSIEGNYSVTLSEKEINDWLGRELMLKQGGELAEYVSMKRVWVRLMDGVAEVVMVREISGREFTTSMFLQIEQTETSKGITTHVHLHGGGFHELLPFPSRGGRFGQLTVPQGFLILVMPDFQKIAALFEQEIELGFRRMARIKIEDKRLVLDPKQPTSASDAGETSF